MAPLNSNEIVLDIREQNDIARTRRAARGLALELGLKTAAVESAVLAASELATNLLRYAQGGSIHISAVIDAEQRRGLAILSTDLGPGIADVTLALTDGFSTTGGLGGGLPGVRRLMDEFEIESGPGGTRITARKWST